MKKLIFTLFVMMVALASHAQYKQGRMLVGGGVEFSAITNKDKVGSRTTTNYTTTTFSVGPRFGYFVIDQLAIGATLDFTSTVQKADANDDKNKTTQIALAPFVRYYLPQNIFFEGSFGFGSGKYTEERRVGGSTYKYNLTTWSIGVGYAAFINSNVAIEPMLSYGSNIATAKNSNPKSKDINQGLTLGVGFQIYLGK